MTDLRDLIHRMADELDHNRQCLLDDRRVTHPLADKARAALAEPEPEGPTDEDLESFLVDVAAEHGDIYWAEPLVLARAVLARWGNYSAPQPIPVSERLTVQEISNLPQHWENYIAEDLDGVSLDLDGYFSRADLQQLADSIPNNRSNSNA
jgi:hypothetical protein